MSWRRFRGPPMQNRLTVPLSLERNVGQRIVLLYFRELRSSMNNTLVLNSEILDIFVPRFFSSFFSTDMDTLPDFRTQRNLIGEFEIFLV